jgi:hypothetical protein
MKKVYFLQKEKIMNGKNCKIKVSKIGKAGNGSRNYLCRRVEHWNTGTLEHWNN